VCVCVCYMIYIENAYNVLGELYLIEFSTLS
jgi:hypothetical protein